MLTIIEEPGACHNLRGTICQSELVLALLENQITLYANSPVNTRRSPDVGLMLCRSLRHQPSIKTTSGECLMFVANPWCCVPSEHNTLANAVLMLGQHLLRWHNIKPALVQCVMVIMSPVVYSPVGLGLTFIPIWCSGRVGEQHHDPL